ncbi:OmpA family protein [Pontibacter chitinilyticus]|uniref:OmpA family protein n=1 Tax=Pontibacter chitinilyticus TaxID=2674989 RepID=UPI00321AFF60
MKTTTRRTTTITAFALAVGMLTACNDPKGTVENDTMTEATADTAVMYQDNNGRVEADGVQVKDIGDDFWNNVDFEAPVVEVATLKGVDVEKRATEDYTIYTMDERVMFDTDKATIRENAEPKIQEIANEIKNIPGNGPIRIYGYTDARASQDYNMELSEDRAKSVQDWLQSKGGIDASRISIQPMGEKNPIATNETAAGRQKNRRVAIVVATT